MGVVHVDDLSLQGDHARVDSISEAVLVNSKFDLAP